MKKVDINSSSPNSEGNSTETLQAIGGTTWSVVKTVLSFVFKTLLSLLIIGLISGAIIGFTMLSYLMTLKDTKVDFDMKVMTLAQTSYVYAYDQNGQEYEVTQLHGVENREWVDFSNIPENLKNAFIALEDKRFPEHNGVDWIRTGFAVGNLVFGWKDSKDGGSTITQQLVKNLSQQDEVSIQRKLKEIFKALNLEKEYSKDEILGTYLNVISLGVGTYGVQAASQAYFGKDVSELSLVECASIAAITQNPSHNNPKYNPETNKKRRNECLWYMRDSGYITDEVYQQAILEDIVLKNPDQNSGNSTKINDWYTDLVINDVINDLMKTRELSSTAATYTLYNGGLKIYSAVDQQLQTICEDVAKNGKSMPKDTTLQVGMYFMDYNGRVLATVGRRGEKNANRYYNFAVDGVRQPGSAIKPLSVYGPAVQNDLIEWSTMLEDEPIEVDGSKWPRNSYGYYRGSITAQKALEISSNAAAARLALQVGTQKCFNFLVNQMHITTAYDSIVINGNTFSDINLSTLATGGMTVGITTKEMVAGYAVFGSEGKYYEPYSYYKVLDSDKKTLLDNTGTRAYQQVMDTDSACVMNKLLQQVVAGREATGSLAKIGNWQLFGKTGTTSDNKDRLFVGGSPYCVGGVWVGYEIPKRISTYNHPSVPIWKEIMERYLANKSKINFKVDSNVEQRYFCSETGCFATDKCPKAELGWFKKDSIIKPCDTHGGNVILPGQEWHYDDTPAQPEEPENPSSDENTVSSEPTVSGDIIQTNPTSSQEIISTESEVESNIIVESTPSDIVSSAESMEDIVPPVEPTQPTTE